MGQDFFCGIGKITFSYTTKNNVAQKNLNTSCKGDYKRTWKK